MFLRKKEQRKIEKTKRNPGQKEVILFPDLIHCLEQIFLIDFYFATTKFPHPPNVKKCQKKKRHIFLFLNFVFFYYRL